MATFNSLGSTVTSIDGRVTALENSPGVAPTADLTVNSLTATSFVQTPLLQSAAADLQIRNATTTLRAEDGTLVASFAAGSIGLEQDITVRSDRTLNATTAAPSPPCSRSRATCGCRRRCCAAIRRPAC